MPVRILHGAAWSVGLVIGEPQIHWTGFGETLEKALGELTRRLSLDVLTFLRGDLSQGYDLPWGPDDAP